MNVDRVNNSRQYSHVRQYACQYVCAGAGSHVVHDLLNIVLFRFQATDGKSSDFCTTSNILESGKEVAVPCNLTQPYRARASSQSFPLRPSREASYCSSTR